MADEEKEKELSANPPTGGSRIQAWLQAWLRKPVAGVAILALIVAASVLLRGGNSAKPIPLKIQGTTEGQEAGPVISGRLGVPPASLVTAVHKLATDQAGINARIEAQNKAAGAASSNDGARGQLSPIQQLREQLAAEQLRQEYASRWAPLISATRLEQGASAINSLREPVATITARTAGSDSGTPVVDTDPNAAQFPWDKAVGPYHLMERGEDIDAVLMTALSGEHGGIVIAQVQTPTYVKNTQITLLPRGTKVIGSAQSVGGSTSQKLLSVAFDRLETPDGYAISLDETPGLSQDGETGLTGKVNNHWKSTIGAAIAIGALGSLSQIGNSGSYLNYSPGVAMRNGISSTLGGESNQIFSRFLNVPVGITIPAGSIIHVVLIGDLKGVPEWSNHRMVPGQL